ncbi:MAG: HEPN domain-containing protein [Chitinispirillaceae bacterium]|nr:HEPN domain-containing protein [Chitinispirillaceae bacterium]
MMQQLEECSEWLRKANRDLLSARILLFNETPVADTACFHCQQAVEKTLKAFLIFHSIRFDRVHNLSYLMQLCEKQNSEFVSFREITEELTPFAVEIRYPGVIVELPIKEAKRVLMMTEKLLVFIKSAMPSELQSYLLI